MRVVLGVTGGIAAYKSTELIRLFRAAGHEVRVIPTQNALRFIGKATLEALSGHEITADSYDRVESVAHVEYGQSADLVVVAPATASFLARYAGGYAEDLLGNTLLATEAPVVVAPAMHSQMWNHPATIENVSKLRARGVQVIEPSVGALTSGDTGIGRLPEPVAIFEYAIANHSRRDLKSKSILITAGGTRVAIDPVRFIGNRSSGAQGVALAEAAMARGADVTLIAANLEVPYSGKRIDVSTNLELEEAVLSRLANADVLVMAAAVADFQPTVVSDEKISRQALVDLKLTPQKDLLAEFATVCEQKGLQTIRVAFAAESRAGKDLISAAFEKLERKRAHLIVANDISGGAIFGQEDTSIVIVGADQSTKPFVGSKREAADVIWDSVAELP